MCRVPSKAGMQRRRRATAGSGGAPRHQEPLLGIEVEGLHLPRVPPQDCLGVGHVAGHGGGVCERPGNGARWGGALLTVWQLLWSAGAYWIT